MVAKSLLFAMHTTYAMVARSPRHPTPGRTLPGRTVKAKGSSPHLSLPFLATIYYVWVDFISIAIYYQLLSSLTTITVTDVTVKVGRVRKSHSARSDKGGRPTPGRTLPGRTVKVKGSSPHPPPFLFWQLCLYLTRNGCNRQKSDASRTLVPPTTTHQKRVLLHPTHTPIMFALQFCTYTMH